MRRHDLAYLRPGCHLTFQCGAIDPVLKGRIAAWISAGHPLVVARQVSDSHQTLLGLTLPAIEGKRRVGCLVDAVDVDRITPPLAISAILDSIPHGLDIPLMALARTIKACDAELGLFGSLAWEILTGKQYRNEHSDVDVICDIHSLKQVPQVLEALKKAAAALPCGLDGEIRFPNGHAVSWKELANIWPSDEAQILVKAPYAVFLSTISTLIGSIDENLADA